jgi:hypothetical protein
LLEGSARITIQGAPLTLKKGVAKDGGVQPLKLLFGENCPPPDGPLSMRLAQVNIGAKNKTPASPRQRMDVMVSPQNLLKEPDARWKIYWSFKNSSTLVTSLLSAPIEHSSLGYEYMLHLEMQFFAHKRTEPSTNVTASRN